MEETKKVIQDPYVLAHCEYCEGHARPRYFRQENLISVLLAFPASEPDSGSEKGLKFERKLRKYSFRLRPGFKKEVLWRDGDLSCD
jgi:hypothetical protein